jgi:hypothetical protein
VSAEQDQAMTAPRALRHSRACNSICELVPLPSGDAYQVVCILCGPIMYIPTPLLVAGGLVRPPARPAPIPADCPAGRHPYELTRWTDRRGTFCDSCESEEREKTKARGAAIPRRERTG